MARKFGITEEAYQRSVLAGLYGNERAKTRARRLGAEVQRMLDALGEEHYSVTGVKAEMFKGRWVVAVQARGHLVNVAIPRELADDVLDSHTTDDLRELKKTLLSALEPTEPVGKR